MLQRRKQLGRDRRGPEKEVSLLAGPLELLRRLLRSVVHDWDQFVLPAPGEPLAMSGDTGGCHNREDTPGHLVGGGQGHKQTSCNAQNSPNPRIILPPELAVLGRRKPPYTPQGGRVKLQVQSRAELLCGSHAAGGVCLPRTSARHLRPAGEARKGPGPQSHHERSARKSRGSRGRLSPFYPPGGFLRSVPLGGGGRYPEENQFRENELFPPLAMKLESCHLNKQGSLPFERCLSFCLIQTSHFSCKI